MRRRAPRKDIVLLLPALPNARPGPSQAGPSTLPDTAHPPISLDGLLEVQKLARKQGKRFDLESFMTPELKAEYYARTHPRKRSVTPQKAATEDASSETPFKRARSEEKAEPTEPIVEIKLEPPPALTDGGDVSSIPLPVPLHPHIILEAPQSGLATPTAPKRQKPNLLHMHWKRREKLLAQWEAENAMEAAGIPIDPAHSVETILNGLPGTPIGSGGGYRRELSEKEKEGITQSASYWNSLLIQARKARGPQWDFNTQQHQVDRHSHDYYSHRDKPIRMAATAKEEQQASAVIDRNGSTGRSQDQMLQQPGNLNPNLPNGIHPQGGHPQQPVPIHLSDLPPRSDSLSHTMPRTAIPQSPSQASLNASRGSMSAAPSAMPNMQIPQPQANQHTIMQQQQQMQNPFGAYGNLAPGQLQALMAMQAQAQAQNQGGMGVRPGSAGGSGSGQAQPIVSGAGGSGGGGMQGINPAMMNLSQAQQQQLQQRFGGNPQQLQAPSPQPGGSSGGGNSSGGAMQGMNMPGMMPNGPGGNTQGGGLSALQQAMQGIPGMPSMQGMQGIQGLTMAQLQTFQQMQQQHQQQQQQQQQMQGGANGMQFSNMPNGMNMAQRTAAMGGGGGGGMGNWMANIPGGFPGGVPGQGGTGMMGGQGQQGGQQGQGPMLAGNGSWQR